MTDRPGKAPSLGEVERLIVRRSRIACQQKLSVFGSPDAVRLDMRIDEFSDALVAQLAAYVAANTIHREVQTTERVPVSWWDGFKLAWFPRWALRRWPAKERTIETEVHFIHMCPHLPFFEANEQHHVVWLQSPGALRRYDR